MLVHQIDLNITHVGAAADEVVAHQPVEVDGGGGASVDLVILHLGHPGELPTHRQQGALGMLQGRPLRHVEHQLEFRLVVKGEHLEHHPLHHRHGSRPRHQQQNDQPKLMSRSPGTRPHQEGGHQPVKEPGLGLPVGDMPLALEQVIGQPGGEDKGHQQGDEHPHARIDGDGAHVGAHQAADEGHGQQGRDDGQGRQYGRPPHLVHRARNEILERPLAQAAMAVDVLHHDDGVIHQDADGEDQRKEGHPVEGKAPRPAGKQGQCQGDDDGDPHHQRLAPPHAHQHQQYHRRGGKDELADEGVGFGLGGDAVVTGHRHLDASRDEPVPEALHPCLHPLGHLHRVLPRLLTDGQGHRRVAGLPLPHPAALDRGLLTQRDPGHIPQIDRLAVVQPHHQFSSLLLALQELPHLHLDFPVILHHGLLAAHPVGGRETLAQFAPADAMGAEGRRVRHHPQHGALAAQRVDIAGTGNALEFGLQLMGDPGQIGGP